MSTYQDLCANALMEIGALAQGENIPAGDASFAQSKLNRLLDSWAARRMFVYAASFKTFTLVPNLAPHTIGPSGTFVVTPRPVKLVNANLVLNTSTPAVTRSLRVYQGPAGAEYWASKTVQGITSTVPIEVYYSPDLPNGSLYFWPVPTFAYGMELEVWGALPGPVKLTDALSLAPSYEDAITLSLAESLWRPFHTDGQALPPDLAMAASKARAVMASPNTEALPMQTDAPQGSGRSYFNYLTGDVLSR